MAKVSEYPVATRASGDYLLGHNAAGQVKRYAGSAREVLSANRTYYVRAGGADNSSHTGLTNNDGDALLTFQYLYDNIIAHLDFNGFDVTMQGDGSTRAGFIIGPNPWVGCGTLILDNAGGTLTSVDTVVTVGNYYPFYGFLRVQNAIITATGGSGFDVGIGLFDYGRIEIGTGVVFGACTFAHRYVSNGAFLTASNAITVNGNTFCSIFIAAGIYNQNIDEDIASPITVTGAYLVLDQGEATASFYGTSYTNSGNVTGQKFFVGAACQCYVPGGATELDFFPGTIPGMIMTAGRYNDWPLSVAHTVTTGDVVVKPSEQITIIEKTVGAATQVTMPTDNLAYGSFSYIPFTIKDGKGDAATHNITIVPPATGTIDGDANYVINTNYGSVTIFVHPIGATKYHISALKT